jgi:Tol biopolymer transport system component
MRRLAASMLTMSIAACGPGVRHDVGEGESQPVPVVVSTSPTSATSGDGSFLLTVSGVNFLSTSRVRWNGADRPTAFINASELRAAIPDSDLATAGSAEIVVFNPSAAGGLSNAMGFTINNPAPGVVSLSPDRAVAGTAGFTLTVNGTRFVPGSTVLWNNAERATTFVSGTRLIAAVGCSDLAAGPALVTVSNPLPGGGTSDVFTFTVKARLFAHVSVTSGGSQPGLSFNPSLSASGRFVAFQTGADLIGGGAASVSKVYLRDTCAGGPSECVPSTALVASMDTHSFSSSVSADGRYVAFDVFRQDTFADDMCTGLSSGCTRFDRLVSDTVDGTRANGESSLSSISANGRYVAFQSDATNLVAGDTNAATDVFLRDTCVAAGPPLSCVPSTRRVSVASDGAEENGPSFAPSISADGRFVAFLSDATNLASDGITSGRWILVRDTCTGAPSGCVASTIRVAPTSADPRATASISSDGRFVAFSSDASEVITGETNPVGEFHVFVRETCAGAPGGCVASTTRVSAASDGSRENSVSFHPSISADGRFVAFQSHASNLTACDVPSTADIFVRDSCIGAPAGCVPSTVRISVSNSDIQPNGESFNPSISADGRFVAFESLATNLLPGVYLSSGPYIFLAPTGF